MLILLLLAGDGVFLLRWLHFPGEFTVGRPLSVGSQEAWVGVDPGGVLGWFLPAALEGGVLEVH